MAQLGSSNQNSLPGIVFDQPEIFESEPALSDDTGVNDLDLINEPTNEAIALIEVPIKQAFSYFAERENEIAKFYVQRHGEYKISGDNPENETDVEKYHRLISEVNTLLDKFKANRSSKSELSAIGSLDSTAITNNLDVLSRQLKSLEFAASDGSLDPSQAQFIDIKSKLSKLNDEGSEGLVSEPRKMLSDETSKLIRMSALERRLNFLETVIGNNEAKTQNLLRTTKSESLTDVADTLSTWLTSLKPEGVQRISRELDYLTQRLEKIDDQVSDSNVESKAKLDRLCSMVTASDKHRAMVPTIMHRLNAMEELQQKAAKIVTSVNHLEQMQSQIAESLQSNSEELTSLKSMFEKNIEIVREVSADIESRIIANR